MPKFTLWSKDRLIGRAKIMYFPPFPGMRVGDFEATELGEQLMSVILGVRPAIMAFYDFADKARRDAEAAGADLGTAPWPESVKSSTEYADMVSSQREFDSLELVLKDSYGRVVPTEWIDMRDAEKMTAEAHQIMMMEAESMGLDTDMDDSDPDESDVDEPDLDESNLDEPVLWEPNPPKYQIQLMLEGGEEWLKERAQNRRKGWEEDLEAF
jgi:hypothetical protein